MQILKSRQNQALIGASVALVGFGSYLFFKLFKNRGQQKQKKLEKEFLMKVLKQYNKEFFKLFQLTQMMGQQLQHQLVGHSNKNDLIEIIKNDPQIVKEIQKIEAKIEEQFNVSAEELQYNLDVHYKDDKDCQDFKQKLQKQMDLTSQGKEQELTADIPDFLTPQKTLELAHKIMEENSVQMLLFCKEYMEKNNLYKIDFNNQDFLIEFSEQMKNNSSAVKILEESGLKDTDEHVEKIFKHAQNTFKRSNIANFTRKSMQLEQRNQQIMQQIITSADKLDENKIRQQFKSIQEQERQEQLKNEIQIKLIQQQIEQQQKIERQKEQARLEKEKEVQEVQKKLEEQNQQNSVNQLDEQQQQQQVDENKQDQLEEKREELEVKEEKIEEFVQQKKEEVLIEEKKEQVIEQNKEEVLGEKKNEQGFLQEEKNEEIQQEVLQENKDQIYQELVQENKEQIQQAEKQELIVEEKTEAEKMEEEEFKRKQAKKNQQN